MNRILVTGANGFIGSHLVELLAEKYPEDEIICAVRHTSDLSNILEPLKRPNVRLVIADVTRPETLRKAVRGVHYIFHLAAALKIPDQKRYFEVNSAGTENMLIAAYAHAAATLKRFVLVSSEAAAGPSPGITPVDEDHEPSPVCPYGRSKLEAERLAAGYIDRLPITIVRPSAVYGEREKDLTQVIPAIEHHLHPKIGFTKKYAGFIHAADLVRGMLAASLSDKAVGQTYFLTHQDCQSDVALVKTMARAIGKPFGIILPIPKFMLIVYSLLSTVWYRFFRGRPGMALNMVKNITQKYWTCSPAKAQRDFGWAAEIPLAKGMKRTYEAFKQKERLVKQMPDEKSGLVWLKYFVLTLIVGAVVEGQAVFGGFFHYKPWWMLLVIILVVWGGILGLVAMKTRRLGVVSQFLITFVAAYLFTYFDFRVTRIKLLFDGRLFGLSNTLLQTAILAASAAVLVLAVNFLMAAFYRRKLRIG